MVCGEEIVMSSDKKKRPDWVEIRKKLLPGTRIDDYYYHIYSDVPPKCTTGVVGFVGSLSNPNIKIRIDIDTKWMIDNNHAAIVFNADPENYYESTIVMTAQYFDIFRKTPYLRFDLWHEVGHYHLGHYFATDLKENGSVYQLRREYLERGEIMPEEKAADTFALYYASKDDAIQALSESIRRRRTFTWELPETQSRAIEEFRRRKQFLRDLDTEDKARAELCKLCGKSNYLDI